MIEINLIPDIKQELLKAQRVRSNVIAASILAGLVSISIVVLLSIYVFAVQTVRGSLADDSIDKGSNQLIGVEDLSKTLTIQNQLSKISALNDSKNIDSRIFDVLAAIVPPAPNDIQISSLSTDSVSSTVTIEGQAANSYAAVEIFKKTIEGAQIKFQDSTGEDQEPVTLASSVNTSDTSYGEDSSGVKVLRFKLSFIYAPELFSPLSKNVSIVIIVNGNVTDSFLGVPNSIFTDRATDITEEQ